MEKDPTFKKPAQETLNDDSAELANEVARLRRELKLGKEAIKQLTESNFQDHLTGLLNMNFYEHYKAENFDAKKDRDKIALVYGDINGLKQVNDTFGHKEGDKLIIEAAEFLKDQFRNEDVIIRLYGDEFIVICRDRKDGISCEKLKARLDIVLNSEKDSGSRLELALGMAVFDGQEHDGKIDADLNDTEIRAEQEMYRVKSEMKNEK